MKKYILLLVSILTLAACQDGSRRNEPNSGKTGSLSLSLQAKDNFTTKAADVTISDFTVVIKNSDGSVWRSWDKFGQGITVNDIPEGNYTLEAFYGENLAAAWDSPYYFGETAFSINVDQTTEVEATATLQNSKITISYTDKLLAELDQIQVVVTGKNSGALTYTPNETRSGYFAVPDDKTIKIFITGVRKSNGESLQQLLTINNFSESQWHKIDVALKSVAGTGAVSLTIDRTLIEKNQSLEIPELDDIVGGGDTPTPDPVAEPTIEGTSFNGSPFNIDQKLIINGSDIVDENGDMKELTIDVLINAAGAINKLEVEIISTVLTDDILATAGLSKKFDLANPTPNVAASLEALKLIDPANPIKTKTSHVFSIGSFIPLLLMIEGATDTDHQFKVIVTDASGQATTKTLTIYINSEE